MHSHPHRVPPEGDDDRIEQMASDGKSRGAGFILTPSNSPRARI